MTRRLVVGALGALGALVLLSMAFVSCRGPQANRLPQPSGAATTTPDPTTTSADFSTVPLEAVPGETTTTFVQRGDAVLTGVVGGPEGNLPGAVVRVERLVGDAVQSFELRAAEDGSWVAEDLPGGRYRVRAYLPPDLTMEEPVVFFLRDDETRDVPLNVRPFAGLDVVAGTTPAEVFVGDTVSLAVRVTERFVDDQGIGRLRPVQNVPVRVRSTGWRSVGDTVDTTDSDGVVVFTYECDRVTPVTATAIVGQDRVPFQLEVPDCEPEATTTTEPDDSTTTTGSTTSSTTSTTGSTTSTTEPTTTTEG